MVIGNKIDLAKRDRAVSKEEGKSLAGDFNAKFLEVSVSFYFVDLSLGHCAAHCAAQNTVLY